MQIAACVDPPIGSPKVARVVAAAIFFHCTWSFSLPAFFSFDCSCAWAAARHVAFGVVAQGGTHSPPTRRAGAVQLAHCVDPAPVHVRHDGSQAAQSVSLVALQTELSYVPAVHVLQLSHVD